MRVFRCTLFPPISIYLVDTPGFDDTNRSDTDVLKEIASWLAKSYQEQIRLKGILFLHRISDPRTGGSARKNLFMFKELCGTEAPKNVLLLTTMWEKIDPAEGERRQKILEDTQDFWGFMIQHGSKIFSHRNHRDSAVSVLKNFVPGWASCSLEKVHLSIQSEMVNGDSNPNEADADKELQGEFQKEHKKLVGQLDDTKQEIADALKTHDREMAEYLRQEQEKRNEELQSIQQESEYLKINMKKLHKEMIQQLDARFLQLQKENENERKAMKKAKKRREDANRWQEEKQQYDNIAKQLIQQINQLKLVEYQCRLCKSQLSDSDGLAQHSKSYHRSSSNGQDGDSQALAQRREATHSNKTSFFQTFVLSFIYSLIFRFCHHNAPYFLSWLSFSRCR